jgi:hypothetical protein
MGVWYTSGDGVSRRPQGHYRKPHHAVLVAVLGEIGATDMLAQVYQVRGSV